MAGPSSYPIARELSPGRAWLVTGPGDRPCVAKRLPVGCLHRGKLHPHVRQRLMRLRELPLTCCGDLIGVERDGDLDYALRPFIAGRTLSELPASDRDAALAAVRRIVAAVHGFGLVHGAVHAGNVLVDDAGVVHLVDASPLLHDDFDTDLAALDAIQPPADPAPVENDAKADRQWALAGAGALIFFASLAAAGGVWLLRG